MAWRSGEDAGLQQELEITRRLAAQAHTFGKTEIASTLEMERLEVLSGAAESLLFGKRQSGALRLLEHLSGDEILHLERPPLAGAHNLSVEAR